MPRLHLVTDDRIVSSERFLPTATALLETAPGRIALHLRAPAMGGRCLFDLAAALAPAAHAGRSILLVNDRVDVAMAADADGVQLGSRGLRIPDVRRLIGPAALIGVSVHSVDEGRTAMVRGADFVIAGTLFASSSHPGRTGTDVDWLTDLSRLGKPVIGIGGMTTERVPPVLAAGAHGVAVLSAIWDAARPEDALRRFMETLYERDGID